MSDECLCVELPGRGARPSKPPHLDLTDCAHQVIADMDNAKLERAHLVAHSLGGATLLTVAMLAPERVASLTFLATPVPRDGDVILSALPPVIAAMVRENLENAGPGLSTPPKFGDDATAFEDSRLFFQPVFLSCLSAAPRVSYIRTTRDQTITPEYQDQSIVQMQQFCRCELYDVGAGHMAMQSNPAALADVLQLACRR